MSKRTARHEESVQQTRENREPDSRQNDVAELAYQRWLERGCPQGSPDDDWFEAERIVQSRQAERRRVD